MTFINPQSETPAPITKPRKDETLQSWLARKIHTELFFSWYPYVPLYENFAPKRIE